MVKRTGAFLMFVIGALLGVRSGIHRRTFSNGGGRIYRVCGDRAGAYDRRGHIRADGG